jgi:hypothetical protein
MWGKGRWGGGITYPLKKGEKKKKNPSINPGQRHLKYTEAGSAIE